MKTKTEHFADAVEKMDACQEAVDWLRSYETPDDAWRECDRGDWMLWLAGKHAGTPGSDGRRLLVLAACECARLSLGHVAEGEDRPRIAIETAERWARDGATLQEVRSAANAAAAASVAAVAAAAAANASASAFANTAFAVAAFAVAAAFYAAANAANVANANANAADAAAAARAKTFAECAAIVRRHYPTVGSFRGKGL